MKAGAFVTLLVACGQSACLGDALSLAPTSNDGGGCIKDCLGGECLEGKCQPIVIAPSQQGARPTNIAVDPSPDGGVFYTTYVGASVMRAEKDGSGVHQIKSFPANDSALGIAFDAHRLYVTTFGSAYPTPVFSMHDDGSNAVELGDKSLIGPWDITFDADYVYWSNRYDNEYVVRAPKAGGPHQTIFQADKAGTDTEETYGIAVDDDSIYWSVAAQPSRISKLSKSGGPVSDLANRTAVNIALDATYVYWCESEAIRRIKKDGTGGVEDLASGVTIIHMALDGGYVYWTEFGHPPNADGTLKRTALDGSKLTETLADGQLGAYGIAFDATAVYWANQLAGTVMKLAK